MQYPAGEIQTPLHSAGERANDVIGARSKSDRLEGALTRSAQRVTREVIHSAPELEILPRREVEIEGNCLRHDSNERARRRTSVDVYAVDGDLARIARENSRDHRDGSGLAGAVGTQQAVNLTPRYSEPNSVDGDSGAEALLETAHRQYMFSSLVFACHAIHLQVWLRLNLN